MKYLIICSMLIISSGLFAQKKLEAQIHKYTAEIEEKMVEWRRFIHQNPELSNREFKTAEMVAQHLQSLGIEVKTGIAHTGVVGVLIGGKPGPVIALRADMDALPVTERVDISFASKVVSSYNGIESGVMHACGHDTHVAILMAAAEVLSKIKKDLQGTVKFVFQPAEEGAPPGEEGGAKLMLEEGIFENPNVDVVFGLHISSDLPVGKLGYKPGGTLAAADRLRIVVKGVQSHGSKPWAGVDPIVTSALIINGLQTIVSRQTPLTKEAAVITIGLIRGGIRNNIIPEKVEMIGTIRTLDKDMQKSIHEKIIKTAKLIAESQGATSEVDITLGVPVTYNDPGLTSKMLGSLNRTVGSNNVVLLKASTGAEDFSFYANSVPGLFIRLGGLPASHTEGDYIPAHHTPDFYVDDVGLIHGLRAMVNLTVDYMNMKN